MENPNTITYSKENPESEKHEFFLLDNAGAKIGGARLEYYSHPYPIYILKWIEVEASNKNIGNGHQVMERVNQFLTNKKTPGVLRPFHSAKEFYKKLGWTKYGNKDLYFFGSLTDKEKERVSTEIYFRLKTF